MHHIAKIYMNQLLQQERSFQLSKLHSNAEAFNVSAHLDRTSSSGGIKIIIIITILIVLIIIVIIIIMCSF